jgi:hypothetical protein
MVQGVDNVLILFSDADMPFWRLYRGLEMKPVNCIAQSSGHESETDKTSARRKVEETLRMLQGGKYMLSVREKFTSNQSGVNIDFEIPFANGMSQYSQPAIGSIGAVPPGFVHQSQLELELVKQRHEYEMKEFNRKLDEIQKKKEPKEDAVGKFLTQYGPTILGVLAQKFGVGAGAQVGLAGFEQPQQQPPFTDPTQQQPAEKKIPETPDEKMEWVINTLAEKEGSHEAAAELLYRFTHYTLQNEAQYNAFKPMILNTTPIH